MSFTHEGSTISASTFSPNGNSKQVLEVPPETEENGREDPNGWLMQENKVATLFEYGEKTQFTCPVLRTVVTGISKALSGNSVVTAPTIHKDFEWLGRIAVNPGRLDGTVFRKHRVYHVRGQLLAEGHVLPWQVGRDWRYSDLHALLVDELDELTDMYGLRVHYMELMSTFPPKTWQTRNSDETSEYRASAIENYIIRGIKITTLLLESIPVESRLTKKQREREAKRKRQRERQRRLRQNLGGTDDHDSDQDNYVQTSADESVEAAKDPEQLERELKQVLDLFVNRLLGVDENTEKQLSEISMELGKLISETPALKTQVTKDFHIDPQQAL